MQSITIIGSGLAGYTLARELRKLDKETLLTIISRDAGDFYSKPMLSTALAQGKDAKTLVMTTAEKMAEQLKAKIRPHTKVTALDTVKQKLTIDNGDVVSYDRLILALGADPIRIAFSGDANDDVLSVNDLDDYAHFRAKLSDNVKRVAIVGAGLIGCEFANDLLSQDYQVDVIGLGETPLDRLIPVEAGEALKTALADAGVHWHLGTTIEELNKDKSGYRVVLQNGESFDCDLVISAIGLRSHTELAKQAGLEINRGIVVDSLLQSSAKNIYALGDCAEVVGQVLPYVMPIMHGARALAKTLTGEPTDVVYPVMPVIVKSTLHPVVVAGMIYGNEIDWNIIKMDDGIKAIAFNIEEKMIGFCLTGEIVNKEKQALLKELQL
ncbi:MAG: FAD-dependent oxidoreductase [Gammaproteobacteria bacterium]|nr:MAG: FAD-dependent oxidoreductase [Gammaproteobacteria bacterium]